MSCYNPPDPVGFPTLGERVGPFEFHVYGAFIVHFKRLGSRGFHD